LIDEYLSSINSSRCLTSNSLFYRSYLFSYSFCFCSFLKSS